MQAIKKRLINGAQNSRESFELMKAIESLFNTQNLVSPGLAIKSGGASPQFLTGALTYLLNGQLYQKVASAAVSVTAAISWTGVASTYNAGAWLVAVDAGLNITLFASNVTSTTASAAAALQGIVWPMVPETYCVIGAIIVNTSTANTTFTGGTTNLDAAGLTVTYLNFTGPFYPAQL